MDTINVAILSGSEVIQTLVFGNEVSDDEIQSFASSLGGTNFKRLAFNEIVSNGEIILLPKPSAEHTWSNEAGNWIAPIIESPVTNPNPDTSSMTAEQKADYDAYLARQQDNS